MLPRIWIYNVGRTRFAQSNTGPGGGETLLQCFANALRCISARGYIVQGAMYSDKAGKIFIDTDDELWFENINIHEEEEE